MKASVLDLRYRTKNVLKAIERGETITLLYRGKEKALIIPLRGRPFAGKLQDHTAFGMWRDHQDLSDVKGHVRRLRETRFGDL